MAASLSIRACARSMIKCSLSRTYSIRPPDSFIPKPSKERKIPPFPIPENPPALEERLKEIQDVDPELQHAGNIGEPYYPLRVSTREQAKQFSKNMKDREMETAARHQTLKVPLEEVKDSWLREKGPDHIKTVAEHYGIYKDLFHGDYFYPQVQLNVYYDYDQEYVTPVHRGNEILPSEAQTAPMVEFESDPDTLWTLILTNPDGHLTDNTAEYLHWAVGNIPGGDVVKGEELVDYLQPFPPRGTGLHRHVFLLFKQTKHLDYSSHLRPKNCTSLSERTFRTADFCHEFGEDLTPVGLAFFQAEWDTSVRKIYHEVLDMREPAFEYDFPLPYHPPMKKYPGKVPFDRYYDRYRDKKDIGEEVMKIKLSKISPFKRYTPESQYPIVHRPHSYRPSWLKKRDELMARKIEQFKDLP